MRRCATQVHANLLPARRLHVIGESSPPRAITAHTILSPHESTMHPATLPRTILLMSCSLLLWGCERGPQSQPNAEEAPTEAAVTEHTSAPTEATDLAEPEPQPAPAPAALAEAPRIDLLHNRYRWHVWRDGLVVPMASESFRKYTQEYRRPFGPVVQANGVPGRVMERRGAELRIPWEDDGAATARIWVHGVTRGQRIQLNINGEMAGVEPIGDAWTELVIPIKAGLLKPGENEVLLQARKSSRVGGERTWGLYHSIEFVPGEVKAAGSKPALDVVQAHAVGEQTKQGLSGFERMRIFVEIPPTAHLSVATAGAKDVRVTAQTFDGEPVTLLEQTPEDADVWTQHRVDLEQFAGRLVAFEFHSDDAETVWGHPFIGVEEAAMRPAPPPAKNLILLVIDALRSDRLALYTDTRVDTPRMTAAGDSAVVFLHNQAASPSSPPSHGSIQTGMIPRVHGVVGDSARLDAGTPMISTQLEDAGIATAYYGNNPFGMGRLEKPGKWTAFHQPNKEGKGIDCTVLIDEMLGFARRQHDAGERFFISSLPYEPHTPYRYHEGISEKYHDGGWGPPVGKSVDGYLLGDVAGGDIVLNKDQWSQLKALYDGEVEYMDQCFGQLVDGLKERGLSEDTAIVLTSDHGEGMFEHGMMGHAFGHYAELANVPLVLYAPGLVEEGAGPKKVDVVTSHLDIAPTVLELMGVTPSERIQGVSVVEMARRQGTWAPRVVSLEYGKSFALRSKRFKLIVDYSGDESLYDLQTDPTEQRDLMGENPFALRYMRDMTGFFLEHRSDWHMATWGDWGNHGAGFVRHIEGE